MTRRRVVRVDAPPEVPSPVVLGTSNKSSFWHVFLASL